MALTATAFINTTAASSGAGPFTTASKTWVTGRWYVLWVVTYISTGTPAVPTATINGKSLTEIRHDLSANGQIYVTALCFVGDGSTGAATISVGGVAQTEVHWSCDEWTGTPNMGTNGIKNVVQSNASTAASTTMATTLANFASATNAAYAFCWNQGGNTPTIKTGYTALATATGFFSVASEYQVGQDTAPGMTQGGTDSSLTTAMEVSSVTIILDAVGTAQRDDNGGTSGALTGSITIGSLTNGILVVCANIYQSSSGIFLDTAGGAAFTQLGTTQMNGPQRTAQIWYLVNPPAGTHNLYVSGSYVMGAVVMSSWSGVNQTTPFSTVSGTTFSGTATTLTITDAAGGIAIDCLAAHSLSNTPQPTPDANGTQLGLLYNTSGQAWAGAQYWAHDGSTTLSWGNVPDSFSSYILACLNPAAGGGGGFIRPGAVFSSGINQYQLVPGGNSWIITP